MNYVFTVLLVVGLCVLCISSSATEFQRMQVLINEGVRQVSAKEYYPSIKDCFKKVLALGSDGGPAWSDKALFDGASLEQQAQYFEEYGNACAKATGIDKSYCGDVLEHIRCLKLVVSREFLEWYKKNAQDLPLEQNLHSWHYNFSKAVFRMGTGHFQGGESVEGHKFFLGVADDFSDRISLVTLKSVVRWEQCLRKIEEPAWEGEEPQNEEGWKSHKPLAPLLYREDVLQHLTSTDLKKYADFLEKWKDSEHPIGDWSAQGRVRHEIVQKLIETLDASGG